MSKPLKKVVTSVTIDPEIFEMGREEGYNFSQLLEKAIIERSDPKRERIYIEGIIGRMESELAGLREKVNVLKQAETKVEQTLFDELVDNSRDYYNIHGMIPDKILQRFSTKLGVDIRQLEEDVIYELSK